ncbi:MAG: BREX-1 system phosphatase PglZ type A [Candidatus Sericytochromatia bacterium]|nr:BREX-1 system phosphatase PglZ type A [Candidatus Sericytochromatia bacterium]
MSKDLQQAISALFQKHRLVFWYDAQQEFRADFEAITWPDVVKLEIQNNQFALKYRILRQEPKTPFLLYQAGPAPADLDNWLLDLQLAQIEFRTDQVSRILNELGLGPEFADLIRTHLEFFKASKRTESLQKSLSPQDTASQIRFKLMAICLGAEPRLDALLESLLEAVAQDNPEKMKLLNRCGLEPFFWEQMERQFAYTCSAPSIQDFLIRLFKDAYFGPLDGFPDDKDAAKERLNNDALVFLKRWKDSRLYQASFEKLSSETADILAIETDLNRRNFRDLIELDYFRLIDQKIIASLVQEIVLRTQTSQDISQWLRQRRLGHWYAAFADVYQALDYAAQMLQALEETNLTPESFEAGLLRYTQSGYKVDQFYRKFIYHMRASGQVSLLAELAEKIENVYTNGFLLKLNDAWQSCVDQTVSWKSEKFSLQSGFYKKWVRPFIDKDKKVCVIISDALRYEIGEECASLIRSEDRYEAKLEAALTLLPSYTQLGMAALLPHKQLSLVENGESAAVLVDGQSSQGTENRIKILKKESPSFTAIQAETLLELSKEASRELLKAHDVLYIYHNRIDHTGDKIQSEGQAFEAAEQTLQELVRLVKKLTGANASNLLITADHGFIYQHRPLEQSDFLSQEVKGQNLLSSRRYVIGKNLEPHAGVHHFSAAQLGLQGELEICLPKSINRLRVKGSGSRFVHGGAALQEILVPVIRIRKKRQSDTSLVEVEIIRGASSIITAGQLAVVFYQMEPVTPKRQGRSLRAGIYTQQGELISDLHELHFDLTSDNSRDREIQVRFVMTRSADVANGQEVILRLEEKVGETTHFREYKSVRYMMRRSFTSDFDI